MGVINLLVAPIRSVVRFPLVQLAAVVAIILLFQAADDNSTFGRVFNGLDKLVDFTVTSISGAFNVKSFTKSWLISGFMIAYVYLACLLILFLGRIVLESGLDLAGRSNLFWLRNTIARSRGVAAYRAWLPFERIRPNHIPQQTWEEEFAWPAHDKPPYPPLAQRVTRGLLSSVVAFLLVAILLQVFTPFPVLTWIGDVARTWFVKILL